ncbi:MAG: UDP-N-acetylmuramate dehydrogenase [Moheibacter sp.]
MEIFENKSLKLFNTFGIEASARYFAEAYTNDEIKEIIHWAIQNNRPILLINGGSNMLLTRDWDGIAIRIDLKGIEILEENEDWTWVKVESGENWHQFVLWTLKNDFGGIENLSLIPGRAGTAPIQNIGAYGVEIKDSMTELTALEISTLKIRKFTNAECEFGYRDSVFKNEHKGKYVILDVTFRLSKRNHVLHTDYGAILSELGRLGVEKPTIQDVSRAIIHIREKKLPDPAEIGNSGSFFKNPVISAEEFIKLKEKFPDLQGHEKNGGFKIAAGWMIEKAGWKGKRFGDAGVHQNQALVLVNYGNATGKEIYDLSQNILEDIYQKFGIMLEREVNII